MKEYMKVEDNDLCLKIYISDYAGDSYYEFTLIGGRKCSTCGHVGYNVIDCGWKIDGLDRLIQRLESELDTKYQYLVAGLKERLKISMVDGREE